MQNISTHEKKTLAINKISSEFRKLLLWKHDAKLHCSTLAVNFNGVLTSSRLYSSQPNSKKTRNRRQQWKRRQHPQQSRNHYQTQSRKWRQMWRWKQRQQQKCQRRRLYRRPKRSLPFPSVSALAVRIMPSQTLFTVAMIVSWGMPLQPWSPSPMSKSPNRRKRPRLRKPSLHQR